MSAATELAARAPVAQPAARGDSGAAGACALNEAELRAWESRLDAREAELDARQAGSAPPGGGSPRASARFAGLLAHAGEWTVRNGELFRRVVRTGEWTVRGGSVYAKMDAEAALLDAAFEAGPDGPLTAAPAEEEAPRFACWWTCLRSQQAAQAGAPPAAVPSPSFFAKLKGDPSALVAPRSSLAESAYSGAAAALGICLLAALQVGPATRGHLLQLVASFGASAVLVFGAPKSPLAQPRNLVLGNVLSAFVGVCVARAFDGAVPWLAPGIAVGLAIFFMAVFGVLHPPGGAISLIAVIGGRGVADQGFMYVLVPATTSSLILLLCALLTNNLHRGRRYPLYW